MHLSWFFAPCLHYSMSRQFLFNSPDNIQLPTVLSLDLLISYVPKEMKFFLYNCTNIFRKYKTSMLTAFNPSSCQSATSCKCTIIKHNMQFNVLQTQYISKYSSFCSLNVFCSKLCIFHNYLIFVHGMLFCIFLGKCLDIKIICYPILLCLHTIKECFDYIDELYSFSLSLSISLLLHICIIQQIVSKYNDIKLL